jgi:DNA modification methylase
MPPKKPVKKPASKPVKKAEKQLTLLPAERMPVKKLPMLHPWDECTVKSIREYDQNPRKNQPVDLVVESLLEFGWMQPITVDDQYVIICGHTRFKAAKALKLTHVPVLVADGWPDEKVKKYRILDNQSAGLAEWDAACLKLELVELEALGVTSDSMGFSDELLAKITGEAIKTLEPEAASGDVDDAPDADEANPPFTQLGDLYEIGPHRLLCGDSTSLDAVNDLMADQLADMVFTDPPYNVAYVGKTSKKLKIQNDEMAQGDFDQFLQQALANACVSAREGAPIYVAHADTQGVAKRDALVSAGFELKQVLIWRKNQIVLGRQDYHWQHEPILYGWKPGAAHTWLGGRNQSTVWDMAKPQRNGEHPTMKPVELVEKAINNSCEAEGRVLDLFGGSGTTMVAAQQTGRVANLMELDPKYCDVIVKRMAKLWPNLPVTLNGEPFALPETA